MTRNPNDDAGLTLIELLVAMSITLIILAPLFTSFVFSLAQSARSEQDVTNSADAQVLTTYFDQDIANADLVGVSSSCGGSASILALSWLDGMAHHYVSYQAVPDAQAKTALGSTTSVYQVTRYECTSPAGPPVSSNVVVRSAGTLPVPTCDATPCSDTTTTPRTVTLPIDDLGRRSTELHYTFTLTGTRRVTS